MGQGSKTTLMEKEKNMVRKYIRFIDIRYYEFDESTQNPQIFKMGMQKITVSRIFMDPIQNRASARSMHLNRGRVFRGKKDYLVPDRELMFI